MLVADRDGWGVFSMLSLACRYHTFAAQILVKVVRHECHHILTRQTFQLLMRIRLVARVGRNLLT